MPTNNLPTYAIVELLMRLAPHNNSIGDYKNHSFYDDGVMVKTTGGIIRFPETLIMQQFHDPEKISDKLLLEVSSSFNPFRSV
jgi:hypothetical protein